jgi:hypothetical protein
MTKLFKVFIFAVFVFVAISCRLVDRLTNQQNMKKVADLWSDVPRMDGLATSDVEMPLYVKVLMRTALNNLWRLNNANEDRTPSTGDWVVFTTTKSPDDVRNFYTNERMTSFGGWDPSKDSTCLDGRNQGFSGIACVYKKAANNRGIGLLIVAAQDEQKKDTSVFFVRVETENAPAAPTQPPKPVRGEIKPLDGTAPYAVEKRPMPDGLNLDQLLPIQVGPYTRTLLEKSEQRGVTATSIAIDGNSVYATYKSGAKEIFVELAVASSPKNAQDTLEVAAGDVNADFDPSSGSIGTEPSYLKAPDEETGVLYAWTRGKYFFSAYAKSSEADLDAFMQSFPY